MKIFLDTGNMEEIRVAADVGLLDAVTTNPSLIARENARFKSRIVEICEVVNGPVSAELTCKDTEGKYRQGDELAEVHRCRWVIVQVPCTTEDLKAVTCLAEARNSS